MSTEEGIVACEAMMEKVGQFPGRAGEFPVGSVIKRLMKSMRKSGRCSPKQRNEIQELVDITEKWVD